LGATSLRIVSTAYAVPPTVEPVSAVMERESPRIEAALRPLSPALRDRVVAGIGVEQVRVCDTVEPYELALQAAEQALSEAGLAPRDLGLIIDFSTIPSKSRPYLSLSQKLAADLHIDGALSFGFKVGGCAGLHLALKNASALMKADADLHHALLVTADSPPAGSRSLFPVTVQGDAAGAVVVSQRAERGPVVIASEVVTLGHLHDAITIAHTDGQRGEMVIDVDSARIEADVMPIYYLNFHRLVQKVMEKADLTLAEIDHYIYANISRNDREGFIRSLNISAEKEPRTKLAEYGHAFAADLVINYTDLCREGRIRPGQVLLFASAGIGFSWGVSLARA
jgi:3-oxoacyl-[acyl-carrier-protein] synthase-3